MTKIWFRVRLWLARWWPIEADRAVLERVLTPPTRDDEQAADSRRRQRIGYPSGTKPE